MDCIKVSIASRHLSFPNLFVFLTLLYTIREVTNRESPRSRHDGSSPYLNKINRKKTYTKYFGLKSLLCQGLSEPEFYDDLVYMLKNIGTAQFIKLISHDKNIGNNCTATDCKLGCLTSFLSSLIARQRVGPQNL